MDKAGTASDGAVRSVNSKVTRLSDPLMELGGPQMRLPGFMTSSAPDRDVKKMKHEIGENPLR